MSRSGVWYCSYKRPKHSRILSNWILWCRTPKKIRQHWKNHVIHTILPIQPESFLSATILFSLKNPPVPGPGGQKRFDHQTLSDPWLFQAKFQAVIYCDIDIFFSSSVFLAWYSSLHGCRARAPSLLHHTSLQQEQILRWCQFSPVSWRQFHQTLSQELHCPSWDWCLTELQLNCLPINQYKLANCNMQKHGAPLRHLNLNLVWKLKEKPKPSQIFTS